MKLWSREPVMTAQIAGAVVALAGVFGLDLTTEQAAGLVSVVSLIAGLIARSQVSPVVK